MSRKIMLLAVSALLIAGVTGCGSPEFVSGTPTGTNVPVTTGQGVNFSTNTITITYDVDIQIKIDSTASINPVPIAVSTETLVAHDGILDIAILGYDSETAYLFYPKEFKLTTATEHTVTVQNIWNENEFMGMSNRSEETSFSFTTE